MFAKETATSECRIVLAVSCAQVPSVEMCRIGEYHIPNIFLGW